VVRGVILLEPDAFGELETVAVSADIALARCRRCRRRFRVLPCEVLPRKRYALAVIAEQVASYASGHRSLRSVAWDLLGEQTPAHTTLHGWTEGLGAHALGRPGAEVGGVPFSRWWAESESRVPLVRAVMDAEVWVDERRYRSEARRERLEAVAKVLAMAGRVTGPPARDRLTECRRLALVWSGSCVLVFPSRFSCTAFEQGPRPERSRSPGAQEASRDRCRTPTRSPPGASSRSRP
jgi:hypothetical protein